MVVVLLTQCHHLAVDCHDLNIEDAGVELQFGCQRRDERRDIGDRDACVGDATVSGVRLLGHRFALFPEVDLEKQLFQLRTLLPAKAIPEGTAENLSRFVCHAHLEESPGEKAIVFRKFWSQFCRAGKSGLGSTRVLGRGTKRDTDAYFCVVGRLVIEPGSHVGLTSVSKVNSVLRIKFNSLGEVLDGLRVHLLGKCILPLRSLRLGLRRSAFSESKADHSSLPAVHTPPSPSATCP